MHRRVVDRLPRCLAFRRVVAVDAPLRMAVIGRQNAYLYLASMTAIVASASAAVITAMKRALSITDISFRIAI